MVKKIYRKLTKEQISRGVIFSSTLSPQRTDDIMGLTTHEVTSYDTPSDAQERIANLKDDKFFSGSQYKYNIIRTR